VFHVLRSEQELYIREGLEWSRIDYFDNESICELIDKPSYGILSLINEPHLNSNDALLLRVQQCCAGHPNFMTTGSNSMCFQYVIDQCHLILNNVSMSLFSGFVIMQV